jgi:hypothetical protein
VNRLDAMLERLPPIYRTAAGSLLYEVMAGFALHLAAFDEDMDRVQRSHWIDHAFDREDLAKLGALFEIAPVSWEPDRLYRARLKAMIAALLHGALTRDVMESVLVRILEGAQEALGVRFMRTTPIPGQSSAFVTVAPGSAPDRQGTPAFVEFPRVRRRSPELVAASGRLRPFDTFTVKNLGIGNAALQGVLYGYPGKRTAAPVLVNLTSGELVVWAGVVPCGRALALRADADGKLSATLDGVDVSDRLITGSGFDPTARPPAQAHEAPRALTLYPGENRIWFFPIAMFDVHGLDVGRLATPSPALFLQEAWHAVQQGVFQEQPAAAGTVFDAAVFHEPPAVVADLWWYEHRPAAFRFEIPAGALRRQTGLVATSPGGAIDALELDRERLFTLLQETVDRLSAAGVDGRVVAEPLRDAQRTASRGRAIGPERDETRTVSTLKAVSALFDVTATEGSRFE